MALPIFTSAMLTFYDTLEAWEAFGTPASTSVETAQVIAARAVARTSLDNAWAAMSSGEQQSIDYYLRVALRERPNRPLPTGNDTGQLGHP